MPWIKKGQSMTQIYTGADLAEYAIQSIDMTNNVQHFGLKT